MLSGEWIAWAELAGGECLGGEPDLGDHAGESACDGGGWRDGVLFHAADPERAVAGADGGVAAAGKCFLVNGAPVHEEFDGALVENAGDVVPLAVIKCSARGNGDLLHPAFLPDVEAEAHAIGFGKEIE